MEDKVIQATDIHYREVGREAKGKDYEPVSKRNVAKLARTVRENKDNTRKSGQYNKELICRINDYAAG